MLILVLFAFLAGVVTILSPCILPILPIVLSGSIINDKYRPYGIVGGFVSSFTIFTLFLSAIVSSLNISADSLRNFSVIIIFIFGVTLLVPQFQILVEKLFARFTSGSKLSSRPGLLGGILVGFSLGLIWTPCVGPILASVITLAASNTVSWASALITLSYAVGTAIPMFIVMHMGRNLFTRVPWLLPNTARIQKIFGVLMILVAIALHYNLHRVFQGYILDRFPSYGDIITAIEQNEAVDKALDDVQR